MDPLQIINKYYTPDSELYHILIEHSQLVTQKALAIAQAHPEFNADVDFIAEAAMLHDIGIFLTHAPDIACYGTKPYICHGTLGSELLKNEGFPRHALVSERHTGAGLSVDDIIRQGLPIPRRDMVPVSIEEEMICYADKFYSKSDPGKEKNLERMRRSMEKYGEAAYNRFERWHTLFSL